MNSHCFVCVCVFGLLLLVTERPIASETNLIVFVRLPNSRRPAASNIGKIVQFEAKTPVSILIQLPEKKCETKYAFENVTQINSVSSTKKPST